MVSEIMLQQTQVDRVKPYYDRFIKQFPTIRALARAEQSDVLRAWSGLGYNRRALNLYRLAQIVVKKYKGKLPSDPVLLDELPGIGKGTAGSIAAFVFNKPVAFIETNIRRVFIHHFHGINEPRNSTKIRTKSEKKISDSEILPLVEKTLDKKNPREWYYALMDYGAHLAYKVKNPNQRSKHYSKQSKFEGSNRQLRGRLLRFLLANPRATDVELLAIAGSKTKLARVMGELEKEGFIKR